MNNKNSLFTLLCPLALLLALPFPLSAAPAPLTSVHTACVSTDSDISCENKVNLQMRVGFGDSVNLDVAYMETVTQKGGGEKTTLEAPFTINIAKSQPVWSYPLRYLHTVDFAPYEELTKVLNSSPGIAACVDGVAAAPPSCGWQLDGGGNRIADSQGFCSNRNLLQLKSSSDPAAWWRGEKELGAQSTQAASFSIGHCLRQSGVSYRGYEIDPPRRDYRINLTGTKAAATLFTFSVSPDIPVWLDRSSAHPIKATLTGEDQPAGQPADLSGSILYVPSAPANDPKVLDWQNNLLLVPRQLVSRDGSDCDRVGSGYSAFRSQAGVADRSVAGACLGNQLKQLLASDLARLAANPDAETDYLVRGKKLFKGGLATLTGQKLTVIAPELVYSSLSLQIDAAQVGASSSESTGVIVSASVVPHGVTSRDASLKVIVSNSGPLTADYLVTVSGCTPGIRGSIPPQASTLAPGGQAGFLFNLTAENGQSGSRSCLVTLTAPSGLPYAQQLVSFTPSAVSDLTPLEKMLKNSDTTVKTP